MAKQIWDYKTGQYINVETDLSYAQKSYKLSTDKIGNIVDEGDVINITLKTVNVSAGTSIPYSIFITGNTSPDIVESLTGVFTISSIDSNFEGSDVVTLTIRPDLITEGRETLLLSLDGLSKSIEIVLNDVSKTLQSSLPTYTLSSDAPTSGEINEGDTVNFTLNTSNIKNGKVSYRISGIGQDDLSSGNLQGTFTILNDSNGDSVDTVSITLKNDIKTEGDELLTFSVVGTDEKISLVINDTSLNPVYTLSSNKSTVKSGETFNLILNTVGVSDGTEIFYNLINLKSSEIVTDSSMILDTQGDLLDSSGSLYLSSTGKTIKGSFIINSNTSQRDITLSTISENKLISIVLYSGEKFDIELKK